MARSCTIGGPSAPAGPTTGPPSTETILLVKLVLAIIHDYDVDSVLKALLGQGFSVTRIASAGGFLRTGNVTILVGVDDDQLSTCIGLLRQSGSRRVMPASLPDEEYDIHGTDELVDVPLGGVSIFVMPVERFERIYARSPSTLTARR